MNIDVGRLLERLGIEAKRRGREWVAKCPNPAHEDHSPSWRIRDEPGATKHGYHKCFAGETVVLTRDGEFPIRELEGRVVSVLTADPRGYPAWVSAPISCFGESRLWSVTLSRNGVKKVVRATADHRWFVHGQGPSKRMIVETKDLRGGRSGHRLISARMPKSTNLKPSPWGIAAGFTFGDGTKTRSSARVVAYGSKDSPMTKYFPLSPKYETRTVNGYPGVIVENLPRSFKELPSLSEGHSYLYGWLAGYFAADGCVKDSGSPRLASANREHLEFVRRLCLRLGIVTYEIIEQRRLGTGKAVSSLFSLTFRRSDLSECFFLLDHHRERWLAGKEVNERPGWAVVDVQETDAVEKVYCASVPETHNFALAGFILVGNCWPCSFQGGALDLVQRVLGLADLRDARAWVDGNDVVTGREDAAQVQEVEVRITAPRLRFRMPPEARMEPFEEWPPSVQDYWTKERGLEPWQVARWGVGYAVTGRLKGRILIPFRDARGRECGYTARSFVDAERRYLQPEPEEGASANAMFGEEHWPPLEERDGLFVVEGEINGLALEADMPEVYFGATSGSATRPLHGTKLATWKQLFVLTDPDAAGDKLAEFVEQTAGRHARVHRLRMQEGFDPAKVRALRPGDLGAIVRAWQRTLA
jgi:5S rRNA maturation endonuclease (ribonuclease M5)